jgi:hypothetical protein
LRDTKEALEYEVSPPFSSAFFQGGKRKGILSPPLTILGGIEEAALK